MNKKVIVQNRSESATDKQMYALVAINLGHVWLKTVAAYL